MLLRVVGLCCADLCTGYAQVMHRCAYFFMHRLCTTYAQLMHRERVYAQVMHKLCTCYSQLVAKMIATPENRPTLLPTVVLIATDYLLDVRLITSSTVDFQQMCILDSCPRCYCLPKLLLFRELDIRFHQNVVTRVLQHQVIVIQFHFHDFPPHALPAGPDRCLAVGGFALCNARVCHRVA